MFLSLKLDIRGEPTIKHNTPSWSCNKSLGQSKIRQRRTCKNLLKNSNIKEKNQIYYSSQYEHSLIIHQIPANSAWQNKKLQRFLDHVRQLTRSRKWKQKEGRRTSHSYWSWTHGPRGTTHGTSGRSPWRWRVSRRCFLLPAGCRGSFSWQPRS